jgi:cardiolipin synthase A/B
MPRRKRRSADPIAPSEMWRVYCRFPETMIPGNTVDLLVDGESAYEAMLAAIGNANHFILMDSYIFNNDLTGRIFADALKTSARRGIAVYLIIDGVGTFHVPGFFFEEMKTAGVHVLVYRSPAPWRRSFGILRRNHRKMLVVDGHIGFLGGINIGDEWLPAKYDGKGWHDLHVKIKGPVVRDLSRLSISTWHVHGGIVLDSTRFLPRVEPKGDRYAHIVGSRERKKRKAIRQSYLMAIRQAREYIYIANAYFLPDLGFRRALKNACRRGVDVRIMVPKRGDILAVQLASQSRFRRLMRMGARIFLWEDAVLHAKSAVIDDQWATVGSFNIDHRSWTMNLEVNVNAVGPEFASHLKHVFIADQEKCEELDPEMWGRRPLLIKFLEQFADLFRKWM